MAFIDKSLTEAKGKRVIVFATGNDRKDLARTNIPYRHHFIANLCPDSSIFSSLHIARRQRRNRKTRKQEHQNKQSTHNHME